VIRIAFHGTEDKPDGRIIFKTDRFSVFPQLRIAEMNDDGSGVLQLTHIDWK
jgi:hypothetical protein